MILFHCLIKIVCHRNMTMTLYSAHSFQVDDFCFWSFSWYDGFVFCLIAFVCSLHARFFSVLDSLSCFSAFVIVFDIWIHFLSQSYKFYDRNARSFIFQFTYNFFVCFVEIWTIFWIITVVKFIFIIPKVFIHIIGFNFIS